MRLNLFIDLFNTYKYSSYFKKPLKTTRTKTRFLFFYLSFINDLKKNYAPPAARCDGGRARVRAERSVPRAQRPDIRVAAREVGATACPRAAAPQGCALQLRSAGLSVRTRGGADAGAAGVCARGARSTARVSRVRKQGAQSKGTERNRCEKGKAERGT